jgi:hypothetical protein
MGAAPDFLESFAGISTGVLGRDSNLGAVLRRQVHMVVSLSFIPLLLVVIDTLLPSI